MSKFKELINSETPVLVDFYADWCSPCKMMAPILKQVKDSLGNNIRIVKIDTEKYPAISQAYSIRSIPTMILFKNGEPTWTTSGVMNANQLIENLKYYLN
ncbi:MAG: thioredoxin [Salinivirgaceae bacterium]|nr:thioredoxin [Salinivirgaceae bacterium]